MDRLSFVIVTPEPFTRKYGGVVALYKLCEELNKRGHIASIETLSLAVDVSESVSNNTIVIYPEVYKGNPLGAKRVVRWLLNKPGVCGGDGKFDENDLVFTFLPNFAAGSICDGRLFITDWQRDVFYDWHYGRSGDCYCFRKGRNKELLPTSCINHAEASCLDKIYDDSDFEVNGMRRLAKSFNMHKRFICYDHECMLAIYAAQCGCEVIVVPDGVRSVDEAIKDHLVGLAGIAWGFEDKERAINTLCELTVQQFDADIASAKSIDNFIAKCKQWVFAEDLRENKCIPVIKAKKTSGVSNKTKVNRPVPTFYHVACMGNWKEVVEEQKKVFDEAGIDPLVVINGSLEDYDYIESVFGPEIIHGSNNLSSYELPTLQILWEFCKDHPKVANVLYCHTKGVSDPSDKRKEVWRKLMMEGVVRNWEANLKDLKDTDADVIGFNWIESKDWPHFSGNFWMAKASWINQLMEPKKYANLQGQPEINGRPWKQMCCETWIGSKPGIKVMTLGCRNERLWDTNRVFELYAESLYAEGKIVTSSSAYVESMCAEGTAAVSDSPSIEEKQDHPVIVTFMPCLDLIVPEAADAYYKASRCVGKSVLRIPPERGSNLAHSFNKGLCFAMNMRDGIEECPISDKATHLAIQHADMQPTEYWLDILYDEMVKTGADFIAGIAVIKSPGGKTSTAINDADTNWNPWRRLTLKEVFSLPETFSFEDLYSLPCVKEGKIEPELLLNTGCMLIDLRKPWFKDVGTGGVLEAHFEIRNRIRFIPGQGWIAETESEDWLLSRILNSRGAKLVATRKTLATHWGSFPYKADYAWGDETDDCGEYVVKAKLERIKKKCS